MIVFRGVARAYPGVWMQKVCAWCKRVLGYTPSRHSGVTHGICNECNDKLRQEVGLPPRAPNAVPPPAATM